MENELTAVVAALLQSAERVRRTSEKIADQLRELVSSLGGHADFAGPQINSALADWIDAAESYDSLMGDLWFGQQRPVIREAWNPDAIEQRANDMK